MLTELGSHQSRVLSRRETSMTNQSSANYEHPKCYLAGRGACHKTISLEHWMSKSLLRELGTTVAVKGLPGVPVGQAKVIGIGALGANILCKKHNSMLSNLDENALKFFNLRRRIDRSFSKPPFAQMIANYQVDGSLFERWILKALAGMVLSGAAEIDGQKIKSVFSMNTELLFDALLTGHLPEGRGLSLVVSKERNYSEKRASVRHDFRME